MQPSSVVVVHFRAFSSPFQHIFLYLLDFVQNDAAGMAQQVAWAAGKPGEEDVLLGNEADTAAYSVLYVGGMPSRHSGLKKC
ncbi:MAG: hypothetical protein WBC04_06240 [Candidatus Acidiferrales bacterium]